MLNVNYVEPELCELCGVHHEPEYPHEINATYNFRFFNKYKRQPKAEDSYSHCKGLIFECAEIVFKEKLN